VSRNAQRRRRALRPGALPLSSECLAASLRQGRVRIARWICVPGFRPMPKRLWARQPGDSGRIAPPPSSSGVEILRRFVPSRCRQEFLTFWSNLLLDTFRAATPGLDHHLPPVAGCKISAAGSRCTGLAQAGATDGERARSRGVQRTAGAGGSSACRYPPNTWCRFGTLSPRLWCRSNLQMIEGFSGKVAVCVSADT
jgi:hypothetical protein